MGMRRAMLKKSSIQIPELLNSHCSFYAGFQDRLPSLYNYAPEVGDGYLTTATANPYQLEEVNTPPFAVGNKTVRLLNKNISFLGNGAMNNYSGIQFHENDVDVDYFYSFWVKSDNLNNNFPIFQFKNQTTLVETSCWITTSQSLIFVNKTSDVSNNLLSRVSTRSGIMSIGAWQHVVGTFNATTKVDKVWLNGVLTATPITVDNGYTNKKGTFQNIGIGTDIYRAINPRSRVNALCFFKGIEATQEIVNYINNRDTTTVLSYPFT